jgi:hypothetical protein
MSFPHAGLDSKVFAARGPRSPANGLRGSSHQLALSFKDQTRNRAAVRCPAETRPHDRRLPRGSRPFSASIPGQRRSWRASHGPTACVSRFSQPHDAFIRPEHPSLISCQSRSWGLPFRALSLAMQAAAVSGAVALWPLVTAPWNLGIPVSSRRSCLGSAPTPLRSPDEAHQDGPGFRALLHTRVRYSSLWFRQVPSTWLSWVSPSRDMTPPEWPGLHRTSPLAVTARGSRSQPVRPRLRVFFRAERVCLSRGHRPSWDSLPLGTSRSSARTWSGSRLLGIRDASPRPRNPSLDHLISPAGAPVSVFR